MQVLSIGTVRQLDALDMPTQHAGIQSSAHSHALLRVHAPAGGHTCGVQHQLPHPGDARAAAHQDHTRDQARGGRVVPCRRRRGPAPQVQQLPRQQRRGFQRLRAGRPAVSFHPERPARRAAVPACRLARSRGRTTEDPRSGACPCKVAELYTMPLGLPQVCLKSVQEPELAASRALSQPHSVQLPPRWSRQ